MSTTGRLGYKIVGTPEPIVLAGFADNVAVATESVGAAERVISLVQRALREAGLLINPGKCAAMVVVDGTLTESTITLENGDSILSVKPGEAVKYLGCTFDGELTADQKSVRSLNENMKLLTASSPLKPDQKLNILNQYLFPSLTYPLQTAPLIKLTRPFLEGVDVMVRRLR